MDDDLFISDTVESSIVGSNTLFTEFYCNLFFLACLYIAGDIVCRRFLVFVPPLVGQIGVGILFGPQAFDILSQTTNEGWVMLGNLGLVLLICQAGLDMDLEVLRRVGPRGAIMAVVGSILPIGIGILLSRYVLGLDVEQSISAGCSFGPTSAGIAMNVLKPSGILRKDVGQLIVAIAIVDAILALVVLSQLGALVGPVNLESILLPIVSSLLWLLVGGAVALFYMPKLLRDCRRNWKRIRRCATAYCPLLEDEGVLAEEKNSTTTAGHSVEARSVVEATDQPAEPRNSDASEQQEEGGTLSSILSTIALVFRLDDSSTRREPRSQALIVIVLLVALLPGTFYSEASYLLGAFLAGLSCCHSAGIGREYDRQLKRWITWLMRVFFGATIGLQIPVMLFNDITVIWQGFVLSLSLLGKVLVGPLLTPVLNKEDGGRFFDKEHRRDCRTVGLSMAGEAEFAFVTAIFGLTQGLLTPETYASVSFAILLSCVLSPVLLRTSIALHPYEDLISESDWESSSGEEYSDGFVSPPVDRDPEMTKTTRIIRALVERNPSIWVNGENVVGSGRLHGINDADLLRPGGYSLSALPRFWHIQTMNIVGGGHWTISTAPLLRAFRRIQLEVMDYRRWKQSPPDEDAKVSWVYHEFYTVDKMIPDVDGKMRSIHSRQDTVQSTTMDAIDDGAIVMAELWEPKCFDSYRLQLRQQQKYDPLTDGARGDSITMTNANFVLYMRRCVREASKLLGDDSSLSDSSSDGSSNSSNNNSSFSLPFGSPSGRYGQLSTLLEGSSDDDLQPKEAYSSGDSSYFA